MKIGQQNKQFRPVSILLETSTELEDIRYWTESILQHYADDMSDNAREHWEKLHKHLIKMES